MGEHRGKVANGQGRRTTAWSLPRGLEDCPVGAPVDPFLEECDE